METYVAHTLRGAGHDASEDGSGRGVPLVAATLRKSHGNPQLDATLIAGPLCANGKAAGSATQQDAEGGMLVPMDDEGIYCDVHDARHDASPCCDIPGCACLGATRFREPMAFNWQSGGSQAFVGGTVGRTDALQRSQVPAVVYPIQDTTNAEKAQHGLGVGEASAPSFTLQAESVVGVAVTTPETAPCLRSNAYNNSDAGMEAQMLVPFDTTQITSKTNRCQPADGDPCHPLAAQAHPPAIAFTQKDHGADAGEELSPTLRAMEHDGSHANGGGQVAVVAPSLTAFNMDSRSPQSEEQQRAVAAVHEASAMVRRLTPTECERLQGFPDSYTLVTYRGKPAADGPRYRAIGNSIAVPCLAWIGARIELVDAATRPAPPAAS